MCRSIKPLYNFEPPASEEEVHAAALQFVRKISGTNRPSKANQAAFEAAVEAITAASSALLRSLETSAPPKSRADVETRARLRAIQRFGERGQTKERHEEA